MEWLGFAGFIAATIGGLLSFAHYRLGHKLRSAGLEPLSNSRGKRISRTWHNQHLQVKEIFLGLEIKPKEGHHFPDVIYLRNKHLGTLPAGYQKIEIDRLALFTKFYARDERYLAMFSPALAPLYNHVKEIELRENTFTITGNIQHRIKELITLANALVDFDPRAHALEHASPEQENPSMMLRALHPFARDEDVIAVSKRFLHHSDQKSRAAARRNLGAGAIPALLNDLSRGDAWGDEAMVYLEQLNEKEVIEGLVARLQPGAGFKLISTEGNKALARALGRANDEAAVPTLLELLNGPLRTTPGDALRALADLNHPSAIAPLCGMRDKKILSNSKLLENTIRHLQKGLPQGAQGWISLQEQDASGRLSPTEE